MDIKYLLTVLLLDTHRTHSQHESIYIHIYIIIYESLVIWVSASVRLWVVDLPTEQQPFAIARSLPLIFPRKRASYTSVYTYPKELYICALNIYIVQPPWIYIYIYM